MKAATFLIPAAFALLAGCDETMTTGGASQSPAAGPVPAGFENAQRIGELPESLAALAGPNQNLTDVILRPEDGCYWYRYNGPVESTYLPLRTAEGRPICTRSA